jgi:hypothetical protein
MRPPVLVFLAFISTVGLHCDAVDSLFQLDRDISQSTYAAYDAAVRDGAVTRGWIPLVIPRSALRIRETHDIDTNERWVTFDFPEQDRHKIGSTCSEADIRLVCFPPRQKTERYVGWWPMDLAGSSAATNQGTVNKSMVFYSCERDQPTHGTRSYLAVQRSGPRAWYWSGPEDSQECPG